MKLVSALSLVALAAAPALSSAATSFQIDFDKNWAYGETVDNQYAAQGVSFTNVLGVSNDPDFGSYYTNAPSPLGVAMAQLDGVVNTSAFLNVASGVEGALSFFYATPTDIVGAIKAYSGLNGTGELLGTFGFIANSTAYDVWTAATFNFVGTAKSFDLTGTANVAGLDNVSAVPEPTSIVLALTAIGIMGIAARRNQR